MADLAQGLDTVTVGMALLAIIPIRARTEKSVAGFSLPSLAVNALQTAKPPTAPPSSTAGQEPLTKRVIAQLSHAEPVVGGAVGLTIHWVNSGPASDESHAPGVSPIQSTADRIARQCDHLSAECVG